VGMRTTVVRMIRIMVREKIIEQDKELKNLGNRTSKSRKNIDYENIIK
jgi:hypothetical protein